MPALILFDGFTHSCDGAASRHFYDPREKYPGQYDRYDLYWNRVRWSADSMMLRPGYKVILYELPKWQGIDASIDDKGNKIDATYEIIEGAYQDGSEEGRLLCQPINNRIL